MAQFLRRDQVIVAPDGGFGLEAELLVVRGQPFARRIPVTMRGTWTDAQGLRGLPILGERGELEQRLIFPFIETLQRGTTLVELLISMTIFSLALAMVYSVLITVQRQTKDQTSRADSVAKYLFDKGLDKKQAATTSRGAMDAKGTDEPSWALDRRVDIMLAD